MSRPLRVLIVEDSEADAQLLLYELQRGGYDPTSTRVETAEAMLQALGEQAWDVVLADYRMPKFSGLAALELLKAQGLDIPFIIISGAIGEDVAVAAMKAGASDYLMKGNLRRLVPAVERELADAEVRRARKKAEAERDRLVEQVRSANEQLVLRSLQIQDQAAEMEAIFAASPEAIVVSDTEGRIVRMNPVAAELLALSPDEQAQPPSERAKLLRMETPDGKPLPMEAYPVLRALRGETVRGVVVVIHRPSDGQPRWLSVAAAPIRDADGTPRGAVIIFNQMSSLDAQAPESGRKG